MRRCPRRKVALLQERAVVQFVASHNEGQRAYRDRVVIRRTHARPGRFGQTLEKRGRGGARRFEFSQHTLQRPIVKRALIGVHIFVETRQGRLIARAQCATRGIQKCARYPPGVRSPA